MSLNELMKKVIDKYSTNTNKNISIRKMQLMISLGTRIIIIYLLFIFTVGKHLAKYLGYNNLYFVSILMATLVNIKIVFDVVKYYRSSKN